MVAVDAVETVGTVVVVVGAVGVVERKETKGNQGWRVWGRSRGVGGNREWKGGLAEPRENLGKKVGRRVLLADALLVGLLENLGKMVGWIWVVAERLGSLGKRET